MWRSHRLPTIQHPFSHHINDRTSEADSVGSTDDNARDTSSREALNDRFDAASNVSTVSEKDELLATLASDAAKAGEVEIVNQSVERIYDETRRDEATHEAAGLLAKRGLRKPAIELAKRISNETLRDKALSELAE